MLTQPELDLTSRRAQLASTVLFLLAWYGLPAVIDLLSWATQSTGESLPSRLNRQGPAVVPAILSWMGFLLFALWWGGRHRSASARRWNIGSALAGAVAVLVLAGCIRVVGDASSPVWWGVAFLLSLAAGGAVLARITR